jgi:Rieske Fe-S protein
MTTDGLSRRRALTTVAGLGLGLPVLAACSGGSDNTASDPGGSAGGGSGGSGGSSGGGAFAQTGDIPEGGGAIFAQESVVVTQPSAGDFKGFSSMCTHQGCTVASVEGGTINCNCHGSKFSIEDGSVQQGPATSPLPEVTLNVKGTSISKA